MHCLECPEFHADGGVGVGRGRVGGGEKWWRVEVCNLNALQGRGGYCSGKRKRELLLHNNREEDLATLVENVHVNLDKFRIFFLTLYVA
jgi:hypothetical protein